MFQPHLKAFQSYIRNRLVVILCIYLSFVSILNSFSIEFNVIVVKDIYVLYYLGRQKLTLCEE